jgi:hypothetical protein
MANNPLQRTGLLKVSDIMKEKEWLGSENKSLTNLVEGNDRLTPYVVINSLNPLNIRTRITTKPYRISSWYDYNHALTEGSTELNGTITGGTMKSMTKGSNESGPGLGLYNNHLKTLTNHLLNCTAGNATAKSSGNDSFLDVWTRFEVTNAVTAGRGNYYVDNSRAYLQIDLSSISSMRVISKAEILLTCVSNTYTPCRVVLVKYEGGTNFVDYPFYPYSQVISEPVLFASGEQTFSLNSAGVAYLNEKFASGDKYLRVGLITYDYDFLQLPFIGDNLVQGADSSFTSQGHWQLSNSQTASFTTEIVGTRTLPVMKVFPGTSERISLILAGSNYSPAISGGTYYFLNWYYRFGQYPANFDKADFGAYTRSYISGNELPISFLHPDNPTGMSPEWQNGYAFTSVAAGGDLLINVGGYTYPEDSVNEFAMAQLSIVNPIFLKMLGGKYNTPKLKYYYDGYAGAVSTGSVTGVTSSQATVGGTVTTDGRTAITVSGLCWNTTGTPTTSDSKTTNGGTSVTTFSSTATGLTLGQTYYIRPYVTTETGTYYGVQTSFTTLGLPTAQISISIDLTPTSATFRGSVSDDGGQSVTDRGFVYKAGSLPIITDNKVPAPVPTGTGAFTKGITGLSPGTTYYVKTYATNASGTSLCASYDQFSTSANLPTVTTSAATSIAATSATLNGSVDADGGASVTNRGWYYKLDSTPTTADSQKVDSPATGTGAMSEALTGLLKNRLYYVKAFATNSAGTTLSASAISFTTLSTTPTVALTTATNGGMPTSITMNGTVSDDGGHSVTDRGFVYKIGGAPAITDNKTSASVPTGTGAFTKNITGLTPGTNYQFSCYATNADGTVLYGTPGSFNTSATAPVVAATTAASGITYNSATSGGNVTSDGGSSVTARGICWSTGAAPTTSNSAYSAGTGTGSFTGYLTGLAASTTYYVRAYATNANGTTYGTQISFATSAQLFAPTVSSTTSATSITQTTAASGGSVSSDGGATITARGICWSSATSSPTTANSVQTASGTTGSFSANLSGLSASTTYYVRAYATNSQGTTYASYVSFTTSANLYIPSVTTTTPGQVTYNSFWVGCQVTADGGATVTERGYVMNTAGSPTTSSYTFKQYSGTGTGYCDILATGLAANTTYYVKGYAINSQGTAYGSQLSFTTGSTPVAPTATTTSPATSISSSGATLAGNVSADGGASVTEKGICYSTSATPTTANSKVTSGTGTGSISSTLSGLSSSTTYHCRAYAINSAGTAYGAEVDFTTSGGATAPSVTSGFTDPWTSIRRAVNQHSDINTINSEVTSDGGSTITERGICHNATGSPTTADTKVIISGTTGLFDAMIAGCYHDATSFWWRAYAINSVGTSYGVLRQCTLDVGFWDM